MFFTLTPLWLFSQNLSFMNRIKSALTALFLMVKFYQTFLLSPLPYLSCVLVAQSCPTFCDLIDCSPPGSSVHGILQARILEWVSVPSSRRSSRLRDWALVSYIPCLAKWFLYYMHHLGSPWVTTGSVFSIWRNVWIFSTVWITTWNMLYSGCGLLPHNWELLFIYGLNWAGYSHQPAKGGETGSPGLKTAGRPGLAA